MKQKFKIGDEAIALSSASRPNQPRVKGKSYTVTDIQYCPKLGAQFINVNNINCGGSSGKLTCKCGTWHEARGLSWTYSINFVHPEDLESRMEDAVEEEDYELATVIRDVIKEKNA
jgi:hypothetical protein